ncbi:MAG: D-lyxose/D-mannose family sugar isomerase [Chthoniobacterales bacterium]|nr:D-lyxose/D-mannose family sugar isomerase [Chthoniobacterales bacterium]
MKRSEINAMLREAESCFRQHHWALPPNPRWDITDFGLGNFARCGLTLINLAEEPEYCEKLMYARENQITPAHTHAKKKEDIICRHGRLTLQLWSGHPEAAAQPDRFSIRVNGEERHHAQGGELTLSAGERITLTPGIYHAFWASAPETIIGEVSTANDDANDNFFVDPDIGRFPGIEEDEPATVRLVSEKQS